MNTLTEFRAEARAWIEDNLPSGLRGAGTVFNGGRKTPTITPDSLRWAEVCYERGYTAPTWPKEYGGAGMNDEEQKVLRDEMLAAKAPLPLGGTRPDDDRADLARIRHGGSEVAPPSQYR